MKNRVHLICNAHLDPVWQWRWTEGCSEAIATFRNAVEIIGEYPELIFNHNESILYQWVQKYDPPLFHRIKQLVEKGRWHIAGGWFLQPDLNLLPVGNLLRHIQFGRRYFKEHFGLEPRVAYNFDSFGHPATLPGILRDHGYEMYIHQRPEKHLLDLPGSFYQWKGMDGSAIPAYRIEIGLYHTERKNINQRLEEAAHLTSELNRDVALFWGLGDHGGGATRLDLDRIRDFTRNEANVEIIHSTTDLFFDSIQQHIPSLPVYDGSLQRVFTGCYTSLSRIKRKALEVSGAAGQAEALHTCAVFPEVDAQYLTPLHDIWEDILFNDFHDILPGTCTEPAEQDALNLYGRAMENIHRLNMESITLINLANKKTPDINKHIPVTLYQHDPDLTHYPVEFECMSDYRPFWEGDHRLVLYDLDGQEILCQEEQAEARLPFFRWRRKIVFMARGWGAGIKHLYLEPDMTGKAVREAGSIDNLQVGKDSRFGLFPGNIQFLVLEDQADTWGTNRWRWNHLTGTFAQKGEERIIENGPVRTILESEWIFHHSRILVHRIEYDLWPVTELRIRIRWNEEHSRLKIAVDTGWQNAQLRAEIPGGSDLFPADGQEYVHGRWMVVNATEPAPSPDTITLAHNGLHGFDFLNGRINFSVLRSAVYCHEQGYKLDDGRSHKIMDLGIHEVRLAMQRTCGSGTQSPTPEPSPASLANWLITPPLVWPHLPVGRFKY